MALGDYIKTNWLERLRQYTNRILITPVSGGTAYQADITQIEGTITQEGTAVSPTNLQNIEEKIDELDTELFTHEADTNAHDLDDHYLDYIRQPGYGGTGGTSTAYTLTLSPALSAYANGVGVTIVPHTDCGASPTLNVNGKGAIALKKQSGDAYSSGDLKANTPYSFKYYGGYFFTDSSDFDEFFGDGSDGALNTAGNVTISVTAQTGIAIKQYTSITINSGHTLTVNNPCRGLILYSQGDVTISGTITMTEKGSYLTESPIPALKLLFGSKLGYLIPQSA